MRLWTAHTRRGERTQSTGIYHPLTTCQSLCEVVTIHYSAKSPSPGKLSFQAAGMNQQQQHGE